MQELKEKIKNNKFAIGSWITIGDTSIAEIMAKAGFEWLAVDMEHTAITLREAQELIRVIDLCGSAPLVRVSENDPTVIKRAMDAGAHGVIVPMVNTAGDAIKAVNAVRYPPLGTRGVGLGRAQGYGLAFEKYRKWVNTKSVVIVQIEHIEAIDNLEEILDAEGVDGSMIGPYDLSGSLGHPGEFERKEVKEAIRRYEKICKKMNKPMGFHIIQPDPKKILKYKSRGYSFLPASLDTLYLGLSCKALLEKVKTKK